jgi:hypothetical protein
MPHFFDCPAQKYPNFVQSCHYYSWPRVPGVCIRFADRFDQFRAASCSPTIVAMTYARAMQAFRRRRDRRRHSYRLHIGLHHTIASSIGRRHVFPGVAAGPETS